MMIRRDLKPTTLTSAGTYAIKATAQLVGDQVPANDEITGTMTAETPLSGNYNVGSGGDYSTLTQVASKLNSVGVSPGSGFTSISTQHGGAESTLLALYNTIHHFGGIVVAPGYTDGSKFADGNPYGTSHVAGHGDQPVTDTIRQAAAYQGARVARIAAALRAGQAALEPVAS